MLISPLNISPLSSRVGSFNPLNVNGLQLYLPKNNATPSSWLDKSTNAYDFTQGTALDQPTISANSVDYDGVSDFQKVTVSQPLNDSSGILFFSGYYDNSATNRIFCTSDEAGNNDYFALLIATSDSRIRFNVQASGVLNNITSTNTIANGSYYYGYIKSNGASYEINLNGVVETLIITSGSNNGKWIGDCLSRDSMAVGALVRSINVFSPAKINKLLYSNANLSASEITTVNNFMSLPTNY